MELVWSFLCKNMRYFYTDTIEMCKTYTHSTCWTVYTMLCCLPSVLGVSLHDTITQMKLSLLNAMGLNFSWLLPSDAISRYTSESTFARVMTCCLTAPSDYLDQHWFVNSCVLWHSHQRNFIARASTTILYNEFENWNYVHVSQGPAS